MSSLSSVIEEYKQINEEKIYFKIAGSGEPILIVHSGPETGLQEYMRGINDKH